MEIEIDTAADATSCDHVRRLPVRFVDSAGRPGVRLQCQRCGQTGGNVKQNGYDVDKLPAFNQALVDRWAEHCQAIRQARWERGQNEKRDAWFAQYGAYLRSTHWQSVRRRVIVRDGFACQLCQRRVEANTAEVHHLSYATYNQVGMSLPAECVTLCHACHERIEAAKRNEA